jgi:hypothetical protein
VSQTKINAQLKGQYDIGTSGTEPNHNRLAKGSLQALIQGQMVDLLFSKNSSPKNSSNGGNSTIHL